MILKAMILKSVKLLIGKAMSFRSGRPISSGKTITVASGIGSTL
mgnify:CR=1 FL=1